MPGVNKFTDLRFWQRSRTWSKEIFFLTKRDAFSSDRRLVSQINDSSESVMANIAEGFGRGTQGEFIQFIGYALGSLNETQAHLTAAYDREYIVKEEFGSLFQEGTEIRKMTVAFVARMNKAGSGVKHMRKVQTWTDKVWEQWEKITGQERPDWIKNGTPHPNFLRSEQMENAEK